MKSAESVKSRPQYHYRDPHNCQGTTAASLYRLPVAESRLRRGLSGRLVSDSCLGADRTPEHIREAYYTAILTPLGEDGGENEHTGEQSPIDSHTSYTRVTIQGGWVGFQKSAPGLHSGVSAPWSLRCAHCAGHGTAEPKGSQQDLKQLARGRWRKRKRESDVGEQITMNPCGAIQGLYLTWT